MVLLFKRLFKLHIIRYGLVGGLGIPINDAALFLFAQLLLLPLPLAEACAFLLSNLINFTLNQFFTYREQVAGIHGWEWLRRYLRGQLTSLSASLLAYLVALGLVYFLQVDKYLANPVGIVVAFLYNFFLSRQLVFRSPPTPIEPAETDANKSAPRVESSRR
ncbi:MAG TPA: GtrA family protein [Ktedonobacteraceae bacterium]|jgi:putative flippase GtrA